MDMVYAIMAED